MLDGGLQVAASVARAGIPIIIVTAQAKEPDRMVGLKLGADDCVTNPLSPKELVARGRRDPATCRRIVNPATPGADRW
ncbi:MAG: hypothetical protein IMZ44_12465 [Planctomycetes bacterium]|nr:hypothetical protein [Planctomycetota bacterium]